MLIRIYTQQNRLLPSIISRYFENWTLLYAQGFYKGQPESSVVIEIDTLGQDYNPLARIDSIVDEIKTLCGQEAVLVQKFIGGCEPKSELL